MIQMMRGGLVDVVSAQMAASEARMRRLEEQALTGSRMNRPSDMPAAVGEAERLSASVADQEVWQANASSATSLLDTMDSAIGSAQDVIVRAREIAVAMASETADSDGRATAAIEVRALQEELLAAANTEFDGRYVFAGADWGEAAFDDTGTYQGSTDEPSTRVADSRWVRTGRDGSSVFDGDVFAALESLATALEADDADAVSATLDDLDAATTSLSIARAEVGVDTNTALDATEVSESLGALLEERLSSLVSADPTSTYLELTELRSTWESTLQVAASASSQTLFDLLA